MSGVNGDSALSQGPDHVVKLGDKAENKAVANAIGPSVFPYHLFDQSGHQDTHELI